MSCRVQTNILQSGLLLRGGIGVASWHELLWGDQGMSYIRKVWKYGLQIRHLQCTSSSFEFSKGGLQPPSPPWICPRSWHMPPPYVSSSNRFCFFLSLSFSSTCCLYCPCVSFKLLASLVSREGRERRKMERQGDREGNASHLPLFSSPLPFYACHTG